jgi:hypothetical protein
MGFFSRLFGSASSSQPARKLSELTAVADEIVRERRFACVEVIRQRGLPEEEATKMYIDATLGSVDVFVSRFGLSLPEAIDLYCTTYSGRNQTREDLLDLFRKMGHPLAR